MARSRVFRTVMNFESATNSKVFAFAKTRSNLQETRYRMFILIASARSRGLRLVARNKPCYVVHALPGHLADFFARAQAEGMRYHGDRELRGAERARLGTA